MEHGLHHRILGTGVGRKGVVARYGYPRVERGVDWLNSYRGHILDFYLLWMDRSELINDLAVQISEPAEYRRQASGLR